MNYMINHPRVLSVVCVVVLWLTAMLGVWLRSHSPQRNHDSTDKGSLSLVISATLTLLGLIIGFTFSMASTRYDQRRLFEESEANAIGTEYVRADLLPAPEAAATRAFLRHYLDTRIAFYQDDYGGGVESVDANTAAQQTQLWHSILPQAAAQPTPVTALVVSGMNDVLNAQGYTQFAWWNRIPTTAWGLMFVIAVFANGLIGYAAQPGRYKNLLLVILPLIISVSFFLIADIDSPRGGLIRIPPRDLISLAQSINATPAEKAP